MCVPVGGLSAAEAAACATAVRQPVAVHLVLSTACLSGWLFVSMRLQVGWFISSFERQGQWVAGGGYVPLSHAICCRPCLPSELPPDPSGRIPGGQAPLALISLGCHASTDRVLPTRCEGRAGSFVSGYSDAIKVFSSPDTYYPINTAQVRGGQPPGGAVVAWPERAIAHRFWLLHSGTSHGARHPFAPASSRSLSGPTSRPAAVLHPGAAAGERRRLGVGAMPVSRLCRP